MSLSLIDVNTYQSTQQVKEYDEAHREAAETAEFAEADKLAQVMDGAIDPPTALRQQDTPAIGRDCVGDGIWCEFHFECREVLHHECRKISILAEGEQVLLVKCIDVTFGIFFNDPVGDNERATLVGSTDAVHAEAARQTSHRTE